MAQGSPRTVKFWQPAIGKEDECRMIDSIRCCLSNGLWTLGPNVERLEDSFSKLVGTPFSVATNSCTAALHVLLVSYGIGPGSEVVMSPVTFAATANAAVFCGARPVFCDIDPETYNISPDSLQGSITTRTKAVIAVHLGGNPCDMKALSEICEDNDLTLIEDAAHALGSELKGMKCGGMGDGGAFSFYPTKVIGGFEGGMATTRDAQIASRCAMLRNHGRVGKGPVEIEDIGYNYRMNEIQAIVIAVQLPNLGRIIRERARIAGIYDRTLGRSNSLSIQKTQKDAVHARYAYLLTITGVSRNVVRDRLRNQGIETSIMYKPLHEFAPYRGFVKAEKKLKNAEAYGESSVALPIHNAMTEDDAAAVARGLLGAIE